MFASDFLTVTDPFALTAAAFVAGLWCSLLGWRFLQASKGMVLTSMVLPPLVCAALLAINGSLGTGIAILGVFGLVRFRSMPGSGPDIASVFLGMVAGLLISTGSLGMAFALIFLLGLILAAASMLSQKMNTAWTVRILIPENTSDFGDYTQILEAYGRQVRLGKVRSMNMGTMYELEYTFYPASRDLAGMMEQIREKNHNLNVQISETSPELGL